MKKRLSVALAAFVLIAPVLLGAAVPALAAEDTLTLAPDGYPAYPYVPSDDIAYVYIVLGNNWNPANVGRVVTFDASSGVVYDTSSRSLLTPGGYTSYNFYDGSWSLPAYTVSASLSDVTVIASSHNIYDQNGALFFRPPSRPLTEVVRTANLEIVFSQILMILPIGLACLVGWIGLRKAWALLRTVLFQA